jgi:shikimate kinase
MTQINLIGFSTVGKSYIARNLALEFRNFKLFDTDQEICKPEFSSIAEIYYSFQNTKDALIEIKNRETRILESLSKTNENLIIASGPGIPLNQAFPVYIESKKPYVILLEKSSEDIYEGLIKRRNDLKQNDSNPRFGIWDIDVIVDINLTEFPKQYLP